MSFKSDTKNDQEVAQFLEEGKKANRLELNFIIQEFQKLPVEKQREIAEGTWSENKTKRIQASNILMKLLLDNLCGMAEFLNESIGDYSFDSYFVLPRDIHPKMLYFFLYFVVNLEEEKGNFKIDPMQ